VASSSANPLWLPLTSSGQAGALDSLAINLKHTFFANICQAIIKYQQSPVEQGKYPHLPIYLNCYIVKLLYC